MTKLKNGWFIIRQNYLDNYQLFGLILVKKEFFSRDTSLFPDRIVKPAKEKGKDKVLLDKADRRDSNWIFVGGIDVARSGSVSAEVSSCPLL